MTGTAFACFTCSNMRGKPFNSWKDLRENLDKNRVISLALVRLLEIVGEAAGGVSAESRQKFPAIPWAEIVGLRNRLIHGYDSVDLDIVWSIVKGDLPALVRDLAADPDLQNDH